MIKIRELRKMYPDFEELFNNVQDYLTGSYNKEVSINIYLNRTYKLMESKLDDYQKGIFDLLAMQIKEYSNKEIDIIKYNKLLKKSEKAFQIVNILNEKGPLLHKELSNEICVKVNHLSNIMKVLEPFEIVYFTKLGRKKSYNITKIGLSFKNYVEKCENVSDHLPKKIECEEHSIDGVEYRILRNRKKVNSIVNI